MNRAPTNERNTDLMFFNYTWSSSGHKDKEWDSKLTGKKKGPRHRGTIKQKIPCKLPGPFTGSSQLKAGSNRANSNSLTHLGYNLVICNIYSSIAHNSQKGVHQPTSPSTDERINKTWYTCTMQYYSATKRNEILARATKRMKLENIMLCNKPAITDILGFHLGGT